MTTLATPPNFCHQVWMDIDLSEWVQVKQKKDKGYISRNQPELQQLYTEKAVAGS